MCVCVCVYLCVIAIMLYIVYHVIYSHIGINCLTELHTLSIVSNRLTHLPESLGDMSKLCHLYASRNQFRSIPDSKIISYNGVTTDCH